MLRNNEVENNRLLEILSWEGKIVKHFKGDKYLVLDTNVRHTETDERLILYKALYGDCQVYARPAKMFSEKCSKEQYDKYGQEYRFQLIELKSVKDDFIERNEIIDYFRYGIDKSPGWFIYAICKCMALEIKHPKATKVPYCEVLNEETKIRENAYVGDYICLDKSRNLIVKKDPKNREEK